MDVEINSWIGEKWGDLLRKGPPNPPPNLFNFHFCIPEKKFPEFLLKGLTNRICSDIISTNQIGIISY